MFLLLRNRHIDAGCLRFIAMHPFIKILCLLATTILLISASPIRTLVIVIILSLLLLFMGLEYFQASWKMCKRMKWFWLSLLVLYGWFIPGTPVFIFENISVEYIPSIEGLSAGGLRATALLSIVSAVVLMMKSTSQEELIVSIMWLISPLRLLKIKTAQFSARLVLTLDTVTNTENSIKDALDETNNKISIFQHGINSMATLLVNIETQAIKNSDTKIVLPQLNAPELYQWLIPLILIIGLQSL